MKGREIEVGYVFKCLPGELYNDIEIKVWKMGVLINELIIYKECLIFSRWDWLWRDKSLISIMILTIVVVAMGSK